MDSHTEHPRHPDGFRFSENNFDLVRLVAAGEVAVRHALVHLAPAFFPLWLDTALALIPGVPVFFFLSGYLISRSWERSASAYEYLCKRALRLIPALWTCIACSIAMLFACGYLSTVQWEVSSLAAWAVCQGTILQFWNPDFLRGFGTGVVNGSLWSISVEIQFYLATILVYLPARWLGPSGQTAFLLILAALTAPLGAFQSEIVSMLESTRFGSIAARAYPCTLLPWVFMFLLGTFAQRVSPWLVPILTERRTSVLAVYVGSVLADFSIWGLPMGNRIPAYLVPSLGCAVLSLAYSAPKTATKLLRGNDFSYGIYIYHMPIINLVRHEGGFGSVVAALGSLTAAAVAGALSWRLVERPFLKRKSSTIRQTSDAPATDEAGQA